MGFSYRGNEIKLWGRKPPREKEVNKMTNYIKITFYHTMYQKEVTAVTTEVRIENGKAYFSSVGYSEAVELEYVRKIEPLE